MGVRGAGDQAVRYAPERHKERSPQTEEEKKKELALVLVGQETVTQQ